MKLSIIVTILGLCTGLQSAASPLSNTVLPERSIDTSSPDIVWPGSASRMRGARNGQMTNAERMQRGLPPAPPRQRAERKESLDKRLLGAPAQASAGAGQFLYNFALCYAGGNPGPGFQSTTITYTSLQNFADQCAALQAERPAGSGTNFYLEVLSATTGDCTNSINPGTNYPPVACTQTNFAWYVLD